jgi:Bacterial regulatory helix-turn-helix protein, lysR family
MDGDDLRILEAVARHRSMNRAAAELNTVQSNVTARIRLLEEVLGLSLFRRHSRGVELTEAGQRPAFVAGPIRHAELVEEVVFREELVLVSSRSMETIDPWKQSVIWLQSVT